MHLSLIENGAYRRLIDAYYSRELPIPKDAATVYRLIGANTKEEKAATIRVLKGFFVAGRDGYRHQRCDEEIARYRDKREKARLSGIASGQARRNERSTNAERTYERNANETRTLHTPYSNLHTNKNSEGQNGLSRKEQLMNAVRKTAQGMKTKESP